MNIIICGPQGSGKGTQAELIARRHDVPYVSTGDIFRYHLKNQTPLGRQVGSYLNAGALVPDVLTNEIVKGRLEQPDCATGFVLDGYPRNQAQQTFLATVAAIDLTVVINLPDAAAIERLGGRLACRCGLSYHTVYNPPKKAGICDKCGSELFRRDDDQPSAIAQRLAIYHHETEPLFVAYRQQGILHTVDGAGSIDAVCQQIEAIINQQRAT